MVNHLERLIFNLILLVLSVLFIAVCVVPVVKIVFDSLPDN